MIQSVCGRVSIFCYAASQVQFHSGVYLKLQATMQEYSFSYSIDGKNYLPFGKGECAYLTTEVGGCFTGNYIALYCTNTDPSVQKGAFYHFYDYQAYLPPQ